MSGTFIWSERGYFFASAPPLGFADHLDGAGADPWLVLARVLGEAKAGRFGGLSQLQAHFVGGQDPLFVRASVELLGNAATLDSRKVLLAAMRSSDAELSVEACGGACLSGDLDLIAAVVVSQRFVPRLSMREEIGLMLSLVLEEKAGPIHTWVAHPRAEYEALVLEQIEAIRRTVGSTIPIWQGRCYSVVTMVRRMLEELATAASSSFTLSVRFKIFRSRFEAATGIDCSPCFKNGKFLPLAATALLEDFMNESDWDRYQDGLRYFFGHQIPN